MFGFSFRGYFYSNRNRHYFYIACFCEWNMYFFMQLTFYATDFFLTESGTKFDIQMLC